MLAAAPPGPLKGVPLTVKDMFSMPWHGARSATADALLPPGESGLYRRLRDGGAVVAGLANQHALGWGTTGHISAYGAHGNPWDPRRSPGGSSGGSAAAVSARLVAGSVGSDSGGSARIPAAYCGVVGLKLTYGGVPRDGYTGAFTSLSAWGAIARDAADTRLLTEVLLGRRLERGDGGRLRIGIVRAPYWDDCDPAVVASCEQALGAAGWELEDLELSAGDLVQAAGMVRTMCELVPATPAHVLAAADPLVRAYAMYARLWPAMLLARADRVRAQLRADLVTRVRAGRPDRLADRPGAGAAARGAVRGAAVGTRARRRRQRAAGDRGEPRRRSGDLGSGRPAPERAAGRPPAARAVGRRGPPARRRRAARGRDRARVRRRAPADRAREVMSARDFGGISAPMIQNSGMKMPTMNMIQWPLRIDMIPRVTSSTK